MRVKIERKPLDAYQQSLVTDNYGLVVAVMNWPWWRNVEYDQRYDGAVDTLCEAARTWNGSIPFEHWFYFLYRREMASRYRKKRIKTVNGEFGYDKEAKVPVKPEVPDVSDLNTRDYVVVRMMQNGASLREIAVALQIPVGTVKSQTHRIRGKFSRLESSFR